MRIFDTDVLIWVQRGNVKAANLLDASLARSISIQTYMELLQLAPSKRHHKYIKDFIREFDFDILPFTENIGHRAAIYVEEYSMGHGIRAGDAIIAATAVEQGLELISGNRKHFSPIKELRAKYFKP